MDIISIFIAVFAILFASWVIKQELSFNRAFNAETFINNWVNKWIPKIKNEVLFDSGTYCTRAMNKYSNLLEETLKSKHKVELKIIVGPMVQLQKDGDKLYNVFIKQGIKDRIELRELPESSNPPKQHFILIDGKHLLISELDEKGRAKLVISIVRNKRKGKQFRNHFFDEWDKLNPINN